MPSSRNCVALLIILFCCLQSLGQLPEQYFFTHYKLSDGLASNVVNNIVQDKTGFMWLATNNGLQRFDGNKFITFRSQAGNQTALPTDEVTQVYLDKKNRMWVTTTDNRVGIFNTHNFRYTNVPVRQWKQEKVSVDKCFLETIDGTLLLLFRKSRNLYEYDEAANTFVPATVVKLPENRNVNFILQDKSTGKYFLSTDSGFVIYNHDKRSLSYPENNPENESLLSLCGNERFVNYMYMGSPGQFFFEQWPPSSTHPFLQLVNLKTGQKTKYDLQQSYGLSFHLMRGILRQRSGRTWVYGLPFLAQFSGGANPFQFLKKDYNKEKEPRFNQAFFLYEDRQQNLWVCSDMGLYLFSPDAQFFHNYTLTTPQRFAVEGRAQSALQMPNGEIWVSYRDLGISRYTKQMQPLPLPQSLIPLQEGRSVWDIHLHSKTGQLWFGLQGGRLIVFDTATKKSVLLQPSAFEQRAVTQIAEDREGNLWFGNQAGNIVKFNYKLGLSNPGAFSLIKKTGVVEKVFTDRDGFVWAATVGEGLLKIDPSSSRVVAHIMENSPQGYGLWNNNPKDVLQYNDSLLVVVSGALNILNTRTMRIQHITHADGLPSNTIQNVAKDANGVLWLGTLNGLCRADLNRRSFTDYNQSDGLLNESFNVAGAHQLNDGRLLFTSAESFLVFDPSSFQRKDTVNTAFITDFKLMNVSLSVDSLTKLEQINLKYDATNVSFEFSALNYNNLTKLEYYYRLQGFDTAWTRSDNRHQAIYTYLPPGSYQFKVKTKDVEGVYSAETSFQTIMVTPPFWRTWWFYMAIALSVVVVLYLLDRERMKRLATLHSIRTAIASQLHKDVSSTLNNINVLSQIAKLKAEKDVVRSKELIDEISGKSYDMMVSMDEILWSIDPTNDTMEKTLLRIVEFAKTLETAYGATIDLVVHQKVKDLQLDMKVRHEFFLACKETLQCLARSAKDKNIMLDIDLVWSKVLVKILSLGAEVNEDSLQILDLRKHLRDHTEAMNGQLAFEVGKRDLSIELSIPVK